MTAHDPVPHVGLDRPTPVRGVAVGTCAFFALGLLGRLTIPEGESATLAWPAAGAAMVLFWLTPGRQWWVLGLLVAAASVVINAITGASPPEVAVFVVANVVQAAVAVLLLGVIARRLGTSDGRGGIRGLGDFWPVVAACLAAAVVGAVVGSVGQVLLLGGSTRLDFALWWARNAAGSIVVFTTYVVVVSAWAERPGTGLPGVRDLLRRRGAEGLLLLITTAALYGIAFIAYPSLPLAFPLVVPTIWAGLRFAPAPVALFSVAICTAVVILTADRRGAFSTVGPWKDEVLVCQLFIGFVFCLGVLLALGRAERLALTESLTDSRSASESQAQMLSAIIDAMHDGVTLIDESGQVVLRNSAGSDLVRADAAELTSARDMGVTMRSLTGDVLSHEEYPWARALAGETVADEDFLLTFDDGSPTRTIAISARRLAARDGRGTARAVMIYHDVTVDRAQRSALESFARVVAHDLRGPLAAVTGWTEMLAGDLDDAESGIRERAALKLEHISDAAAGMQRMVTDLLDSSVSREQHLRLAVVDLEAVARSVAAQRTAVAGPTPPRIEIAPLPDVHGDAALVRQLLDNLIGNAVKYVAPGQAARVSLSGRAVGGRVEVTVADEGIGIPASERDQIFAAFHRAHAGTHYDGHGIGLAVCQQIVARHGGRIAARAPLGDVGTRIVFTLPAVPAADESV